MADQCVAHSHPLQQWVYVESSSSRSSSLVASSEEPATSPSTPISYGKRCSSSTSVIAPLPKRQRLRESTPNLSPAASEKWLDIPSQPAANCLQISFSPQLGTLPSMPSDLSSLPHMPFLRLGFRTDSNVLISMNLMELLNVFFVLQPQLGLNLHPRRLRDMFRLTSATEAPHVPLIQASVRLAAVSFLSNNPVESLELVFAQAQVTIERDSLRDSIAANPATESASLAHEAIIVSMIIEGRYLLRTGEIGLVANRLLPVLVEYARLCGLHTLSNPSLEPRTGMLLAPQDAYHAAERVNLFWSIRLLDLAVVQLLGPGNKPQLNLRSADIVTLLPVSYEDVAKNGFRAFDKSCSFHKLCPDASKTEFFNFCIKNQHPFLLGIAASSLLHYATFYHSESSVQEARRRRRALLEKLDIFSACVDEIIVFMADQRARGAPTPYPIRAPRSSLAHALSPSLTSTIGSAQRERGTASDPDLGLISLKLQFDHARLLLLSNNPNPPSCQPGCVNVVVSIENVEEINAVRLFATNLARISHPLDLHMLQSLKWPFNRAVHVMSNTGAISHQPGDADVLNNLHRFRAVLA
ncbi:hypothetical protein DL93DRAFT_2167316 [Clavulina sp. PMI_390]|nr:hypothetical protein DL93DRAFT_2167316 [Clavulina sp. PMI_390]